MSSVPWWLSALKIPGNIDLEHRPDVPNPNGGTSSVLSASYGLDGDEVLLPHVTEDGRLLLKPDGSLDSVAAIDLYKRTGKHLGIFSGPDAVRAANAAGKQIHREQEVMRQYGAASQGRALQGG